MGTVRKNFLSPRATSIRSLPAEIACLAISFSDKPLSRVCPLIDRIRSLLGARPAVFFYRIAVDFVASPFRCLFLSHSSLSASEVCSLIFFYIDPIRLFSLLFVPCFADGNILEISQLLTVISFTSGRTLLFFPEFLIREDNSFSSPVPVYQDVAH